VAVSIFVDRAAASTALASLEIGPTDNRRPVRDSHNGLLSAAEIDGCLLLVCPTTA